MPPNFFTKLVRTQTPGAASVPSSSDEQPVTSPQAATLDSQTAPPAPPQLSPYTDPTASSSAGSVKIGVVPPSPRTTDSDLSVHVSRRRPSIDHAHHTPHHHRRVRSQDRDRHIPDRHEVSLAARPTSDISFRIDDTELTPTPGRPSPDWISAHSPSSPRGSSRQLSPASSTGNLKGFVETHSTHTPPSQLSPKFVKQKASKRSMTAATQPPPPLNIVQGATDSPGRGDVPQQPGRHEDAAITTPNIVIESPTFAASQKAQSQERAAVLSDGDTKSVRSAASSKSKHKDGSGRRHTLPRKASGPPSRAFMSSSTEVPPLSPLSSPVPGSRSTPAVNGTTPKRGEDPAPAQPFQAAPPRSPPRTRSPNVSATKCDFLDGDTYPSSEDESSSSSDGLDLDDQDIPVTGFAVASSRRNADFHELFPNIPEGDYLIEDYGCALQREILIQGRLYISENHICFHANIFGWITDLSIPIYEITGLEKKMTAFVIPNAIQITTRQAKYTFASFLSRDTTYDVIANIWRLARPDEALGEDSRNASTREMASTITTMSEGSTNDGGVAGVNKMTSCACLKNGSHLSELALETVLPGTPNNIYNLMFASGFMKDFLKVDQKLDDLQISDWAPISQGSNLLQRNMSYLKPINNAVGPRHTKCEIHDETVHCDFDDYVVMLTSTRTPDVPSGGVFIVRTRTCFMWASSISTRVIVTTHVEWTGRSFIKGIIEKHVIEGQRVYHSDLDKAMRKYIQEHQAEFIPEGIDPSVIAPVEPITPLAEGNGGSESLLSAEEVRKEREHTRNRLGMQWAYDTLDGAYNVGKRSAQEALGLVNDAWEQSSSITILWFVIVFLVLSNLWTLVLVGHREEVGRRKELKRAEEKERWLQGVVAGVWEELTVERARTGGVSVPLASVPVGDVQAEVANIGKVLDTVEQRIRTIRESLQELS